MAQRIWSLLNQKYQRVVWENFSRHFSDIDCQLLNKQYKQFSISLEITHQFASLWVTSFPIY